MKTMKLLIRFVTGGKAYAIMNFGNCWITSTQNGLEKSAWPILNLKNL